MNRADFINTLVDNEWLWQEHKERDVEGIAFKKIINGKEIKYHMSDEGIAKVSKEQLEKKLGSHDLVHMTRIVGYYSRVHNWNNSKLGELKDRQKGQYIIGKDRDEKANTSSSNTSNDCNVCKV